jgi:hypothetical protein
MPKRNKRYVPAPMVTTELAPRLAVILEVLAGSQTVAQGARTLGLSRNHFQTILHRGLAGLVEAIDPKAPGRPAKPQALASLEAEVERLRKENADLQKRAGTSERILEVASGLLQGRIRTSGRAAGRQRRTKGAPGEKKPDEPDATRLQVLRQAEQMRALGLTAAVSARIGGAHEATLRRWRVRERRGEPLAMRRAAEREVPAELARNADAIVRRLRGLVGAEALRHSVSGLSRRQAACVKAQTLTAMERERKAMLTRVSLGVAGVVRGLDGMYFHGADGNVHALFTADAAVPYRTGVKTAARYDAKLVTRAISADIEHNGAPLVYRLDRAASHDAPSVRELLQAHGVLVLHGPPRCPRFYGQLERQNREHRAWAEDLACLPVEEIEARLEQMLASVNELWRRRTLHWKTASEVWAARPRLAVDRNELREEVSERAARMRRQLQHRGGPADLAERLAIEQALEARGFLRQQAGGWC